MTRIEQWNAVRCVDGGARLVGQVVDHPRLGDGPELAMTSPLVSLDLHQGRAETHNTKYQLGTPHPGARSEYELRAVHPFQLSGAVVLTGADLDALAVELAETEAGDAAGI